MGRLSFALFAQTICKNDCSLSILRLVVRMLDQDRRSMSDQADPLSSVCATSVFQLRKSPAGVNVSN